MSDRPIIFSGPMVQAILAGRKTQTRRIAKINAIMGNRVAVTSPDERLIELEPGEFRRGLFHYESTGALSGAYRLPAAVGDRLWVREACHYQEASGGGVMYRADQTHALVAIPWRPSIHMPRWASRLTLTVTDVRVQRLQEISEADAIAEGCPCRTCEELAGMDPRGWFRDLWDSLHGPDAWAANPWVAAITFSVARRNIDAITEATRAALLAALTHET